MRIVDAMTLRDGGTTCVSVEEGGVIVHVTVDHRLRPIAWLPWPRFVFISSQRFGRDRRLSPGGSAEVRYVSSIVRATLDELGPETVRDVLAGHCQNPGQGPWFYVLNFLQIINRVRPRSALRSANTM